MEHTKLNNYNNEANFVFILTSATSLSSTFLQIARDILNRKFPLRLLIRFDQQHKFNAEELAKMESVHYFTEDHKIPEEVLSLHHRQVSFVILASTVTKENSSIVFNAHQELIKESNSNGKIKRICLLSYNDCASKLESSIKSSGMDYLIIKPGTIIEEDKLMGFTLTEGNSASKREINSATAARVTVDSLLDPWIPSYLTLEAYTSKDQKEERYSYIRGQYKFKSDCKDTTVQLSSHKYSLRTYLIRSTFFAFTSYALYLGYKLAKNSLQQKYK